MPIEMETHEGTFSRKDLVPFREAFDKLVPGVVGVVTVSTGELNGHGKGKTASEYERRFRDVAAERNVGLNVKHTNQNDGTTRLSLAVAKKRTTTPEKIAERTKKAQATRAKNAIEKIMRDDNCDVKTATEKYKQIVKDRIAAKKAAAAS